MMGKVALTPFWLVAWTMVDNAVKCRRAAVDSEQSQTRNHVLLTSAQCPTPGRDPRRGMFAVEVKSKLAFA